MNFVVGLLSEALMVCAAKYQTSKQVIGKVLGTFNSSSQNI
jgi:hypothetical protein